MCCVLCMSSSHLINLSHFLSPFLFPPSASGLTIFSSRNSHYWKSLSSSSLWSAPSQALSLPTYSEGPFSTATLMGNGCQLINRSLNSLRCRSCSPKTGLIFPFYVTFGKKKAPPVSNLDWMLWGISLCSIPPVYIQSSCLTLTCLSLQNAIRNLKVQIW